MKQTIIGADERDYVRKLNIDKAILIILAVVAVALNTLFCLLRNDENHTVMLILNILVDIFCGWAMITIFYLRISPRSRLLKLYRSKHSYCTVSVLEISEMTQLVRGIDCKTVTVTGEGAEGRRLFLPADAFSLRGGGAYSMSLVSNVIVSVEDK